MPSNCVQCVCRSECRSVSGSLGVIRHHGRACSEASRLTLRRTEEQTRVCTHYCFKVQCAIHTHDAREAMWSSVRMCSGLGYPLWCMVGCVFIHLRCRGQEWLVKKSVVVVPGGCFRMFGILWVLIEQNTYLATISTVWA